MNFLTPTTFRNIFYDFSKVKNGEGLHEIKTQRSILVIKKYVRTQSCVYGTSIDP